MSVSKYDTHVKPKLGRIKNWSKQGMTEKEICKRLAITTTSLYNYKKKHIDLFNALKETKEYADEQVENSLYKRAMGYEYDEIIQEVETDSDGKVLKKKMRKMKKHVVPDVTAIMAWLANRKNSVWKRNPDLKNDDTETVYNDSEFVD